MPLEPVGDCLLGHSLQGVDIFINEKEVCEDSDPMGLFSSQENTFLSFKENVGKILETLGI